MAFIQCNFYSKVLGMSSTMNVITPENRENSELIRKNKNENYPVLFLLHGLSDDHSSWQRKTSIERYVNKFGIAVVMPNVHRSFYTDMKAGNNYFEFISQELIETARKLFPLSRKQSETYTAGLSMGGYGAFKLALTRNDIFSAAASLSGVLNISILAEPQNFEQFEEKERLKEEFKWIFGDLKKIKNSNNDLFYLLKTLKNKNKQIPKLYQCCGRDDFLYQNNLEFKKFCLANKIKLEYNEEDNAAHEWEYWDKKILDVMRWLSFNKLY